MRNFWGGFVESKLPSSRYPGFVRQASGVMVGGGRGEGVSVAGRVGRKVAEGRMGAVVAGFDGEQAENPPRSRSSIPIRFIA